MGRCSRAFLLERGYTVHGTSRDHEISTSPICGGSGSSSA